MVHEIHLANPPLLICLGQPIMLANISVVTASERPTTNKIWVSTDLERGALLYPLTIEKKHETSADMVLYTLTDQERSGLASYIVQPKHDFPERFVSLRKACKLNDQTISGISVFPCSYTPSAVEQPYFRRMDLILRRKHQSKP